MTVSPMQPIRGVMAPCITPFREDGEVDEDALASYLDFLADHVHGIVVCAIYGSGILMRPNQRQRVAERAVEIVGTRARVLVFAGAADTDTATQLARHAEQIGADGVTCVAPFYYRQVDEALFRHFKALVDAVDLPVYAYDSPVYAGNQLSFALLEHLASAGLAGVVTGAASFGIEHLWECIRRLQSGRLQVLSIRDGIALPAMMMGAVGFDSGAANFFPELAVELYEAVTSGRYEAGTQLQKRILQFRDISHALGRNIPTLHALIGMRGFATGVPKRPFFPLSAKEVENLRTQLAPLGFPPEGPL
ncbi:MAG: dihydrodipicolinate synthase family protein [Ardenticatenaceae bacterium]|nr:dihydrodipicolinate synthase family protein [Ardenticatenaceae bacterium]